MVDRNSVASRPDSAAGEQVAELQSIPLIEEQLSVTKRQVESGRVRIHVTVEEREELVSGELLRDDLQIERVTKNVRVAEAPQVRVEGDVTIVPVVEEVLVVEKALVLVEELHIRRHSVPETVEIPVPVRAERARVERQPSGEPAIAAE